MNAEVNAIYASLPQGAILLHLAPFVTLLLAIAILPLLPATRHAWESARVKLLLSVALGALAAGLYYHATHDSGALAHAILEYGAFIALLSALYVISGGVHISGRFAGFPHVNTAILALGAILANVLGTTGASMLLLRPLLRANQPRKRKTHIVIFFIFIVSNCGGLLTPLGDPPLLLGFLRGVPFAWTLGLWKIWALTIGALLAVFHFWDSRAFTLEDLADRRDLEKVVARTQKPLHLRGAAQLAWLPLLLASLLWVRQALPQIALLGIIAGLAYTLTPKAIHRDNQFEFAPLLEVATLFIGIFLAMVPALAVLGASASGFDHVWQYFWATGMLSAFLDNAPTYVSMAGLAAKPFDGDFAALAAYEPMALAAISAGAVLMGALTYIGNGPNFMVKAMAEHAHIKMPGFGGYMLWSFGILVPIFLLVTAIFF